MSFKEVNSLRKEGKVVEAYELARIDIQNSEEGDIWAIRGMSWVLIAFLKQNASYDQRRNFLNYLKEFSDLNMPEDEELVYENLKYWIVKFLFSAVNQNFSDNNLLNEFTNIYKELNVSKPSELHSKVLTALLKKSDWQGFFSFIRWWDLDNLRTEDYQEEEYNGKKMMTLAERAYIAYSKAAILTNQVNDEVIQKLENFVEKNPKFIYPQYYLGKALLAIGDNEEAFKRFVPFARKKRNDFWVWDLLSEIQEDLDTKVSCLCKALTCKSPEKMLVKVHHTLAHLLLAKNEYIPTKFEIEEAIRIRQKEGWKIPNDLQILTEKEWYKDSPSQKSNWKFYKQNTRKAEELLFADIEPEIAIVTHVNTEKSMLNFIVSKTRSGFFNYSRYFNKIEFGDFLKLRLQLQKKETESFYRVLSAEKTDEFPNENVYKPFKGSLEIIEGKAFGFIDNIFVPPYLIEEKNLRAKNGNEFAGKAVLNFNKRKGIWDWKILSINEE